MTTITQANATKGAEVMELVIRERAMALSARELRHRLAGYGYRIRETLGGQIVETLPHGIEVCAIPAELQG